MASSKRMLANKAHHSREKCLFEECVCFYSSLLGPEWGEGGGARERKESIKEIKAIPGKAIMQMFMS